MKKILLVFAHPDDESFTTAGTVAKYVKAGWEVDLVCATRGEKGEVGLYVSATPAKLGEIRQKELEQAARKLGISNVTFLDYKDGELEELEYGELEDILYRKIEETVPDCVITFDTTGISNHPDHIKVCFATTYAFQKYAAWVGDQLQKIGSEQKGAEPKLYYACMPESLAAYLIKLKNIPDESFGRPWKGSLDKLITAVIDVGAYKSVRRRALQCHVSQQKDVSRFLSLANHPLLSREYFILRMHGTTEVFMGKNDRVSNRL